MLVTKKYEKDTIATFKLVNGDEIVAKVVDEQINSFVLSKPTTVIPSAQGIALMQSLFTGDLNKDITLDKRHIMMDSVSAEEIKNHYIQTTTGIQPVSQGGLLI